MSACGYTSYEAIIAATQRTAKEIQKLLEESQDINYGKYNNYASVKVFKF